MLEQCAHAVKGTWRWLVAGCTASSGSSASRAGAAGTMALAPKREGAAAAPTRPVSAVALERPPSGTDDLRGMVCMLGSQ